ncbi:MAG: methionyl-tRNA formyltransferase [Ruminococcaceae bacterium]|nr:methionyl-tRNA formyltransferase [Oscillospiraceae bacterium]
MKIVFMGTPDYAVKTLEKLIDKDHEVAAVFAQPDKPVGRKHILTAPPVKETALKHGIKVFQPTTLKNGEAAEILREIAPDVIVVVAYGKILPKEILSIAKFGCVNGHASLLPKYRGASPIQWCIVCGERETGVTTMLMDEGMDTGDILKTETVKIGENETAEELFERLSEISADLMVSTLDDLEKGEISPQKQDEADATYAPIIKKEMALIDFGKTAKEIFNAVRGYYSWPCAYFFLNGKRVKVIKAEIGDKTEEKAGTVVETKEKFAVACGDGVAINLLVVQPEGSKPMTAKQFFCGNSVELGAVIGEENG